MKIFIRIVLCLIIFCASCTKEFLNVKPNTAIVAPKTLADFQNLLDDSSLNQGIALSTLAADEYTYVDDVAWLSTFTATERNSYIWSTDLYDGEGEIGDWNKPYTTIFYANSVLMSLAAKTDSIESENAKFIKGWALFIRSNAFFQLVQNFAPIYDEVTASTDLGIPLRLKPEVDEILERASVKRCYDQIIADLIEAKELLPIGLFQQKRNRPSKEASLALLARVYLFMRNYEKAYEYANATLSLYDKLIDYNTVSLTATSPFPRTNEEVLFSSQMNTDFPATAMASVNTSININQELMALYEDNDLRKNIFFGIRSNGTTYFKRGYNQSLYGFNGLSTDEQYLIKAECLARKENVTEAMTTLNALLINRYKKDEFEPAVAKTVHDALLSIINERRKQLIWRGLRWFDIKRLNKEGWNIQLSRTINNENYDIPPNDLRYVFPIPNDEINRSGIKQNKR